MSASRLGPKPETDYSPKEYTLAESLRSCWKYIAVAGIILLLFWLMERYR